MCVLSILYVCLLSSTNRQRMQKRPVTWWWMLSPHPNKTNGRTEKENKKSTKRRQRNVMSNEKNNNNNNKINSVGNPIDRNRSWCQSRCRKISVTHLAVVDTVYARTSLAIDFSLVVRLWGNFFFVFVFSPITRLIIIWYVTPCASEFIVFLMHIPTRTLSHLRFQ